MDGSAAVSLVGRRLSIHDLFFGKRPVQCQDWASCVYRFGDLGARPMGGALGPHRYDVYFLVHSFSLLFCEGRFSEPRGERVSVSVCPDGLCRISQRAYRDRLARIDYACFCYGAARVADSLRMAPLWRNGDFSLGDCAMVRCGQLGDGRKMA